MHCSAEDWDAVECRGEELHIAEEWNAVECRGVQGSGMQCRAVKCSTEEWNELQKI